MGLRVVQSTLKPDWDKRTWELANIRGSVQIDITPACILQPDLIFEISELIAAEIAHDTLAENIRIDGWKVVRTGDRLEVTAQSFTDEDAPASADPVSKKEFIDMVRPSEGWSGR